MTKSNASAIGVFCDMLCFKYTPAGVLDGKNVTTLEFRNPDV